MSEWGWRCLRTRINKYVLRRDGDEDVTMWLMTYDQDYRRIRRIITNTTHYYYNEPTEQKWWKMKQRCTYLQTLWTLLNKHYNELERKIELNIEHDIELTESIELCEYFEQNWIQGTLHGTLWKTLMNFIELEDWTWPWTHWKHWT